MPGASEFIDRTIPGGSALIKVPHIFKGITVGDVGTTWVVDIYDTDNLGVYSGAKIWTYKSAHGSRDFTINKNMKNGLTVVSNGTAGFLTIRYK